MMLKKLTYWKHIAVCFTVMGSVCLHGCEIPPTETSQEVSGVAPTAQPGAAGEAGDDADKPNADTPVGALIHRIDLPLDVSLDPLWDVVDESVVTLRTRGMWRTNGLRIGVLSADDALAFAEQLPTIHGESRAKLIGSPYPSSVRSTPRLIQPVMVDLTDPPKSPVVLRVRGGRLQLLAKITRDESGQAYLELTPHHYKPKPDLVPRSPLEKQLDGRVFVPLTARLALTPDTAVVVGLHRPWPDPEVTSETGSEDSASTPTSEDEASTSDKTEKPADEGTVKASTGDADPQDTPDTGDAVTDEEPKPPAIPDHLGRALMAGRRAGQDTQVIMVISIIEDF